MFAVLLFQVAMLGVMALTDFAGGFILLLLPAATLFFWVWFHRKWTTLAIYNPIEQTGLDTEGNMLPRAVHASSTFLSLFFLQQVKTGTCFMNTITQRTKKRTTPKRKRRDLPICSPLFGPCIQALHSTA